MLLALVAGCGTRAQREPEPVEIPAVRTRATPDGTAALRIYLVRDGHLVPVIRRARPAPETALALLAAGPTPAELAGGLRSALPVRPTAVRLAREEPAAVVLEIDADVTLLPEDDRLPAVAQLVWTATESLGIDLVRVQLDRRPLALPTDTGPPRSLCGGPTSARWPPGDGRSEQRSAREPVGGISSTASARPASEAWWMSATSAPASEPAVSPHAPDSRVDAATAAAGRPPRGRGPRRRRAAHRRSHDPHHAGPAGPAGRPPGTSSGRRRSTPSDPRPVCTTRRCRWSCSGAALIRTTGWCDPGQPAA